MIGIGPGVCRLSSHGADILARIGIAEPIAPGDVVCLADRGGGPEVVEILPRRSRLSRPDPALGHQERVIAANVDRVVVVASACRPAWRPRLVDRVLVAAAYGGAHGMVCVNKEDLLACGQERSALERDLARLQAAGTTAILVSATTGNGLDSLRTELAGRLAVFVGQSGVGKSTLVNALDPSLGTRTGEVQERSGKGKHTTTSSSLLELPGGIRIIDTPGVRSFGLWAISPAELAAYFPEFTGAASHCRFTDCTHDHEPECGVRAAASAGTVAPGRFESYLRILASLRGRRAGKVER